MALLQNTDTNFESAPVMEPRTILVVDDDSALAQAIALRVKQLGFHSMRSPDAMHALMGAHKIQPDLIIMDINLPGGNGLAVCEMLATDPASAQIPVVVHSGCSDDATRNRCRELGVDYVLKTPGSWEQLKAAINRLLPEQVEEESVAAEPSVAETEGESATENVSGEWPEHRPDLLPPTTLNQGRERIAQRQAVPPSMSLPSAVLSATTNSGEPSTPPSPAAVPPPVATPIAAPPPRLRVLCIDDNADVTNAIKIRLERSNVEVICAINGTEGVRMAREERLDAIVTDLVLPEGEGAYIVRALKSHPECQDIPVIVLTGQGYDAIKRQVLQAGAVTYLTKPVSFAELLHKIRLHVEESDSVPV